MFNVQYIAQMASLMVELDEMTRTIELIKKPDGSKKFPARSCCDLKSDYSETKTGYQS